MIDIIDRLRGPASSILAMRDAADEIERLRRMLAASQWRSIESISLPPIAPDGDDPTVAYSVSHNVIFFDPDIGLVLEGFAEDRVDISADNWIRGALDLSSKPVTRVYIAADGTELHPTHWMPLPAALAALSGAQP